MLCRTTALSVVLLFCCSSNVFATEAQETIRQMASNLQKQLRVYSNSKLDATSEKEVESIIRKAIEENVDLTIVSRWILGDVWENASEEQKLRFKAAFSGLLIKSYTFVLLDNIESPISYNGEEDVSSKGKIKLIKTDFALQGERERKVNLHYRMYRDISVGKWKIIDVIVDGVSIIKVYRSDMRSILQQYKSPQEGMNAVIQHLVQQKEK